MKKGRKMKHMVNYKMIGDASLFTNLKNIIDLVNKPIVDINKLIEDLEDRKDKMIGYYNNPKNSKVFKDEEEFEQFFTEYYSYLECFLIDPIEKDYFMNQEKNLYHATPLFNLKGILEIGKLVSQYSDNDYTDEFKDKTLFFSEYFIIAFKMGWRYIKFSKFYHGTAMIIPDTNNHELYKKIQIENEDTESVNSLYTNKLNPDHSISNDDYETIKKAGITKFDYNNLVLGDAEVFTKEDVDWKRIYIISPEHELIRIYNNLGNGKFEIINTEVLSDVINRKPVDVYKL
jgi:hypothetical protein